MERRRLRLLIDTFFIGLIGALAAQLFAHLVKWCQEIFLVKLAGYHPPGLPSEGGLLKEIIGPHGLILVPLATTLGGLISGILVFTLAPEAEGHGTDAAVKAFHLLGGKIRVRVPFVKMIASAITIGSGGAAGREGPTAQIASGVGSIYAQITRRSEAESRLLILMGMAAGLSAIFLSPIGAAIFAIEILYSEMDYEAEALVYTLLSSVIAYSFMVLMGRSGPLFNFPSIQPVEAIHYLWYAVLGLTCGVFATLLPAFFYWLRDVFLQIPLPPHIKPALGALGVGILALKVPQVLGGGYGWIQLAIDGKLHWQMLGIFMLAKFLAFPLTISSGGSGGVFAPSLFIGAMLGGTIAGLLHLPPAPFVVVGMAALFGAAARVPVANMFMVTEMTGAFHILPPAALSVMLAYVVQAFLSSRFKYHSLYESQVPTKIYSSAHKGDFFTDVLEDIRVKDIFQPQKIWALIPEEMKFKDFIEIFGRTEQHYFPVVNKKGELVGIFSINDIRPFLFNEDLWNLLLIKDLARKDVITTHPSEDIHSVLRKFTIRNIDLLPVVSDEDPSKFLGMLSRREVISYYNRLIEDMQKKRSSHPKFY